mgnify:CR=1 FL=1
MLLNLSILSAVLQVMSLFLSLSLFYNLLNLSCLKKIVNKLDHKYIDEEIDYFKNGIPSYLKKKNIFLYILIDF